MRIIVTILVLVCIISSPALSSTDLNFDEFIKSREVVTTLYFQPNNEDLSSSERERLSSTISKLRELQEDGRMIRVEGFSSSTGDREKNFILSLFRARSVAVLIESKGLPAEVTLTGYGDLRSGPDDQSSDRRVEIASYLRPVGMQRVRIAGENRGVGHHSEFSAIRVPPKPQEIDAYVIEQAIRIKVDDKNLDNKIKGLAEKNESKDKKTSPGLGQKKDKKSSPGLSRTKKRKASPGLSRTKKRESSPGLSRTKKRESSPGLSRTKKRESAPGLSQTKNTADKIDLDRGYNEWRESVDPDLSRKSDQAKEAADSAPKRGFSKTKEAPDSDLRRGFSQAIKAADSDLRGYSQTKEAPDSDLKRGYSQTKEAPDSDLKRGYSQTKEAADSDLKRGYSQTKEAADSDLKRGYSQTKEAEQVVSPGVTQVMPVTPQSIDALMIEQVIVEMNGSDLPAHSGEVSQVDIDY